MAKIIKVKTKYSVKYNGRLIEAGMTYRNAVTLVSLLTGQSARIVHLNR